MTETTVLVTGATGFIAGHCIEELLSHGYAVRGTVRHAAPRGVAHLGAIARRTGGSLEFAQASLDDDAGWAEAVRGCTYVWHLASPVPAKLPKDETELTPPAVDGTLRGLRAAPRSEAGRRRIIAPATDP